MSSDRPRWARHWDPHPICWLCGLLRSQPDGQHGLGMRTCPDGGVAITLPDTHLLIGAGPVDQYRLSWEVHTHDPIDPDGHEPNVFGRFTWVTLVPDQYDGEAGLFRLPDGSTLNVPDRRSANGDVRYRVESRAQPGRLIPATETWSDLVAMEQIAERIRAWLANVDG